MATTKKTSSRLAKLIGAEKIAEVIQTDFTKVAAEAPELIRALAKNRQVLTPTEKLSAFAGLRADLKNVVEETGAQHREMRKKHSEQLQDAIEGRAKRLEAYAIRKRTVIKPKADAWVVSGQVADKSSGNGIPNLIVRAYDMDRVVDDYLGTARTDALGYYRIEYTEAVFKTREEGKPEVFILVLDDDNNTLYTSPKSFVEKSGTVQKIDAQIDGSQVPGKMKLSQDVSSFVTKALNNFNERRTVLDNRKTTVTKPVTTLGSRLSRAQKATVIKKLSGTELKRFEETVEVRKKTSPEKKPTNLK